MREAWKRRDSADSDRLNSEHREHGCRDTERPDPRKPRQSDSLHDSEPVAGILAQHPDDSSTLQTRPSLFETHPLPFLAPGCASRAVVTRFQVPEQHGGKRARIPSVQEVRVYVCTNRRRPWLCSCELPFVHHHLDDARPPQGSTRQSPHSKIPVV